MKIRFGIKALLLLTLFVATALPIFFAWQFERKWSKVREELSMIAKDFDGETACIHTRSIKNRGGKSFKIGISNREFKIENGITKLSAQRKVSNSATDVYYIQPPGIWVPDIEAAIETWDRY